jgi:hypothetical protein
MHAAAAVALLHWEDTKLHARVAALLQWQVLKLQNKQTCNSSSNNNNNKARCIPAELCKLSRVKQIIIYHHGQRAMSLKKVSSIPEQEMVTQAIGNYIGSFHQGVYIIR